MAGHHSVGDDAGRALGGMWRGPHGTKDLEKETTAAPLHMPHLLDRRQHCTVEGLLRPGH